MARTYDENDLASLDAPALQRALLKVPDDLLAQAIGAASHAVAARLAKNLSRRRRETVRALASRLEASGETSERSGRAALRSLVRRVFEMSSPEAEATEASSCVGAPPKRKTAVRVERDSEPEAPDLTPGAYSRLREARAVFGALSSMSPHARSLEETKRTRTGAALVRTWMGRDPRLDRRGRRWYARPS